MTAHEATALLTQRQSSRASVAQEKPHDSQQAHSLRLLPVAGQVLGILSTHRGVVLVLALSPHRC